MHVLWKGESRRGGGDKVTLVVHVLFTGQIVEGGGHEVAMAVRLVACCVVEDRLLAASLPGSPTPYPHTRSHLAFVPHIPQHFPPHAHSLPSARLTPLPSSLTTPTSLSNPPYPSPPTPPLPHPTHTLPSRGVPSSSGRQLSATWRHNPCVVTAALPPCSATFTNTAYGSTPAIRHLLLSVVGMAWAVRTYTQRSGSKGQGG